jgi:hypothetical protein
MLFSKVATKGQVTEGRRKPWGLLLIQRSQEAESIQELIEHKLFWGTGC